MEDDDDHIPEPDSKGTLLLSNRAWINLDPSIWTMASRIMKLDISYNHIVELPSQIGEMAVLRELIACFNKLEVIPASLGRAKRLRRLVLNSNRLRTIPAELGNLDLLEELLLSENMLEDFPNSIAKIPNLRIIKLANNRLREIPFELADLISLEDIDCSNNQNLEMIPANWRGDTASIIFVCRVHRDYNIRMQEMMLSNVDLTKHSQVLEQDNLLLKVYAFLNLLSFFIRYYSVQEKVLQLQAKIDELYKNMPKSVLRKLDQAAAKAKEDEIATDTENDKRNKCTIS